MWSETAQQELDQSNESSSNANNALHLHQYDRDGLDPISTSPLLNAARLDAGSTTAIEPWKPLTLQSRMSFSAGGTSSPGTIRKSPSSIQIKAVYSSDNLIRTKNQGQSPLSSLYKSTTSAATTTGRTAQSLSNNSQVQSRSASPSVMSDASDELPNNVMNEEQLDTLPAECLSGDPIRPLRHFNEDGDVATYALRPMMYSVIFILIVELLERFAFYGINYTQTSYLTGLYNPRWNAGMESVTASSYVSISVAVAYTTPFLGAFFADQLFGDYYSILVGTIGFYLPGLFLIAFTTVPKLLGQSFNNTVLATGLLFMWPVGTGIVKSVVNVFGAKQFHPLLQSSSIEAYYVNFYMCINVGALIGGVVVPVMAQHDVTLAYFLPVTMLCLGVILFLAGSSRYVCSKPKISMFNSRNGKKKIQSYDLNNNNPIPLLSIAKVSLLIVPFSIAYSQMGTTFVIQGTVMQKAFGWIDAATMNNADAVAVLGFGYLIGNVLYPSLANRGIKIPTTYKFAIGSAFGAMSIAWALLIEVMIHKQYADNHEKISIMWQTMPYTLIGIGEIFAVSAAYEVAFTASPPEKKVLSSAVNLFCIGGLPNVICIALYQACRPWFTNSRGTTHITHISEYASARVDKYFWVLLGISILGVLINLLPSVREYVESIEERATDMIRTPKTPKRPPRREPVPDEEEQLLKAKRHQYYLKYGSGPSLYKLGSMRAGPALKAKSSSNMKSSSKRIKKSTLARLYKNEGTIVVPPKIVLTASGKPIMGRDMPSRGGDDDLRQPVPTFPRTTSNV